MCAEALDSTIYELLSQARFITTSSSTIITSPPCVEAADVVFLLCFPLSPSSHLPRETLLLDLAIIAIMIALGVLVRPLFGLAYARLCHHADPCFYSCHGFSETSASKRDIDKVS